MRRAGLIASLLAFLAMTLLWVQPARAESGWTWTGKEFAPYHFTPRIHEGLEGRAAAVLVASQRERAMQRAREDHRTYAERVARLLAEAERLLTTARSIIGGGIWGCIAQWESGSQNSWAGFFGFIYPPSSYPEPGPSLARRYGSSWLAWPYSAQLQVAIAVQAAFGWSAWGPTTRARCGL